MACCSKVKFSFTLDSSPGFELSLSGQFRSVAQSCLTLWNPVDCSMPGFAVHHQLPELTQTHVLQVGDATQPSHPLLSPSPPAFSFSQHQSFFPRIQFFASGGQSIGVSASSSVLPMKDYNADFVGKVMSLLFNMLSSWS